MYIGPWQEFKLARLIQQQQNDLQLVSSPRRPPLPRRRSESRVADDAVSVASSSRSGFSGLSTRSAPARLPQQSAQARLNGYYDAVQRSDTHRSRPPSANSNRPRSGVACGHSGGNGSRSVGSLASGRRGNGNPAAKKKNAKISFEEQRKARILQMQRLYGLAQDPSDSASETLSNATRGTAELAAVFEEAAKAEAARQANAGYQVDSQGNPVDMDLAIRQLQTRLEEPGALEEMVSPVGRKPSEYPQQPELQRTQQPTPVTSAANVSLDSTALVTKHLARSEWPLPTLPEDPMNVSMASSVGLIAWTENLKAESLSPQASLTNFFQPY